MPCGVNNVGNYGLSVAIFVVLAGIGLAVQQIFELWFALGIAISVAATIIVVIISVNAKNKQ